MKHKETEERLHIKKAKLDKALTQLSDAELINIEKQYKCAPDIIFIWKPKSLILSENVIKFKNVENQHPNIIIIKELQRIIKYLLNLKQLFLKNFIGTMYLPIRIKEFMDMKSKVTYRLEGYYLISNSNLPDNKIAVDKYGKQKVKYLKINK